MDRTFTQQSRITIFFSSCFHLQNKFLLFGCKIYDKVSPNYYQVLWSDAGTMSALEGGYKTKKSNYYFKILWAPP